MSGDTVASGSVAISENELMTMANSVSLQEVGGVVQVEDHNFHDSLKLDDGFDEVLKLLAETIDEDLSQASQECPSMEGGLAANSQIKGVNKTDSKKQRKTLYKGIKERRGKWGVIVRDPIKGVNVWAGTYDTDLEAALAYDAEAKRRRGKKARLNFPDEAPPKKSRYLPGRSASSGDAQGRNSNVEVSARCLNGVRQIFQSDSPLQCRSVESPIPGYMHISSVETPLVPFHDHVQGINSENFMTPPLQSRTGESPVPGDMHISPVETPLVQFHDQVQGINSENFMTPPLQSRSGDSTIPGDMHISSVETPLVPFHDQVQGINSENFTSEFESGINSENISEFVSNVQSVENHIEFRNLNSDYNRSYFDDWCSPQGVDDVNTSFALSTTDLANWANIIGISEGNNTMHISSVETPLVPFHDQVQGIDSENFMSEFESGINSENISEFVSNVQSVENHIEFRNVQSVENHIEFRNLNSDYNRNYFDDWCSPQGVDDVNTSSALSTTDLANWASIIGISEGNNRSYFDDWCSPQGVADVNTSSALSTTDLTEWANIIGISEGNNTTMVGNVEGQATMDIPEGILQNASSLIGKNVLQPQTSQVTLKSNSIEEPGMDSFLALLQFPESTGHADTSGINISFPEEWNFDDEMSKLGF